MDALDGGGLNLGAIDVGVPGDGEVNRPALGTVGLNTGAVIVGAVVAARKVGTP